MDRGSCRYGTNRPKVIKTKSLCELICEQFEDPIIRILIVAATVSLLIGIWKEGLKGARKRRDE